MSNFFDRFKPGAGEKNKKSNNIFDAFLPGQQKRFQGQGQSLGGSLPGKVIPIELKESGSLGIKIEKRSNSKGTAIVAMVVPGSQAEKAGLQRGDILCFAGSQGTEEIMYDMFVQLAASEQRPLCFEVRRIKTKDTAASRGGSNASAEAYARKQAVIAAAEAREKAQKAKSKPIPKKDTRPSTDTQQLQAPDVLPKSEASKKAAEAAKNHEAITASQLGYNPYETNKATAGQARTATVAVTHGTIQNQDSDAKNQAQAQQLPAVRRPTDLPREEQKIPPNAAFDQAFETLVTSNEHEKVVSSIAILRKLIANAATKGQNPDDPVAAAKFRRVRLANAKINEAIVAVDGALDLMLCTGFQLIEEHGESVLVFPLGSNGPDWLPSALEQMESYEKS